VNKERKILQKEKKEREALMALKETLVLMDPQVQKENQVIACQDLRECLVNQVQKE